MDGKDAEHTSSPFSPLIGFPSSSKTSTFIPSPLVCSSPDHTGPMGFPRAKQDTMSDPPEIDDRTRSCLMSRYTNSKLSTDRGEPVERMARREERSYRSPGLNPSFSTAAMYLALVPKTVIFCSSANFQRAPESG